MNDEEDSGGGGSSGGLFGGFLSGLFGGHKAGGGPLDPGKWYIAGEHGPEPIWGGGPGAFAAGYSGASTTPKVSQYFDMRGSIVTDDVVRRAELAASHRQAVKDAVVASHDLQRRR